MADAIKVETDRGIATVTLNRTDVRNAMSPEMISQITSKFKLLSLDSAIRAVVLSGEGTSFCAGADLNYMREMAQYSKAENVRDAEALFDMFAAVASCAKPVVGYIHGHAFGGGLGLVAGCDIVLAEEKTQFCFSEVKLGIVPAVISPFAVRKMGLSHAMALMISADVFTAQRAREIGLVHFIGNTSAMDTELKRMKGQLLAGAPSAHFKSKQLLFKVENTHGIASLRSECAQVIAEQRVSADGQEGLKSFLEKRDPSWKLKV